MCGRSLELTKRTTPNNVGCTRFLCLTFFQKIMGVRAATREAGAKRAVLMFTNCIFYLSINEFSLSLLWLFQLGTLFLLHLQNDISGGISYSVDNRPTVFGTLLFSVFSLLRGVFPNCEAIIYDKSNNLHNRINQKIQHLEHTLKSYLRIRKRQL
jgi:hypothetical protein